MSADRTRGKARRPDAQMTAIAGEKASGLTSQRLGRNWLRDKRSALLPCSVCVSASKLNQNCKDADKREGQERHQTTGDKSRGIVSGEFRHFSSPSCHIQRRRTACSSSTGGASANSEKQRPGTCEAYRGVPSAGPNQPHLQEARLAALTIRKVSAGFKKPRGTVNEASLVPSKGRGGENEVQIVRACLDTARFLQMALSFWGNSLTECSPRKLTEHLCLMAERQLESLTEPVVAEGLVRYAVIGTCVRVSEEPKKNNPAPVRRLRISTRDRSSQRHFVSDLMS
jgi:hypothetical protein